ncbi:hypothetical protein K493DRAFT_316887 [Basidiobolus meristosporus CBS 931.73]|uniref:Protein kinase domain-containing protein n=1 Tax=Basidiobolus meristosporus CBS 931.73 TaxID=1314790 RepID=A0A1Y1Y1N4_9FUNG|nr:hypothetical protein K493DRAFT_316887 [Basidiobolus meristosporus CBS 931.73]|eukprot:ORX91931.1 hypothetical protein K493DRAFT_316887 [Basidiobolus meristosporus CBS 931.73]
MSLETYFQVKRRITSRQKYKLIKGMVAAVKVLHSQGIAHCSLSEESFMVNEVDGMPLKDHSPRPRVALTSFKNARFSFHPLSANDQLLLPHTHAHPLADHECRYVLSC